jgi:hypothetical protein
MKLCASVFGLFFFIQTAFANDLLLFGGSNHDEFLGCLVCNEYSAESVCNEYGKYGNEYGSNMWNEYSSPYGNEYSSSSPWNEYSSSNSVPVLVDRQGNFYGFFTINEYRSNAVDFAGQLKKIYKMHDGDVEKVRKTLCDWIN